MYISYGEYINILVKELDKKKNSVLCGESTKKKKKKQQGPENANENHKKQKILRGKNVADPIIPALRTNTPQRTD